MYYYLLIYPIHVLLFINVFNYFIFMKKNSLYLII